MPRVLAVGLFLALAAGCGGAAKHDAATTHATSTTPAATRPVRATQPPRRFSALRLPGVRSHVLPGYLLVADRNNDRVILLAPDKRIVWQVRGLREPDDAFFTPGFRSIVTNEEFDDTLAEISLRARRVIWRYGHAGAAGSAPGYLHAPDDAYRMPNGVTTVADIQNCRIVQLTRSGSVLRVLGGTCGHDPPRGFASPNGDTPLPDGGLLVTEIGGWIDRLSASGRLVWSVRSPVSYPSDAQLLPSGRILVAGFTNPGRVVELTRSGRVVWSFGSSSGEDRLDRPSLAIRLPNGLIAVNDDWRHRVILIDPRSHRIVWQYGRTDVASSSPGYLDKPDGMDFLPASSPAPPARATTSRAAATAARRPQPLARLARVGSLPEPVSRLSAVALPDGRVVAVGGLVAGASTARVLVGPPARLRPLATLPQATHDAAAVLHRGRVIVFGGGEATSSAAVERVDPTTGSTRRLAPLDEPLSDLGAAEVAGRVYLVGGYTGTRFASAVLRVGAGDRTTTVARLPEGLRYAGVSGLGGRIYVAGGVTPAGPSASVWSVSPRSGRVRRVATLPRPLAHAALAATHGTLWLVGGDGSRDVLRIDPRHGTVRVAARLPAPLADAAAVALPDGRVAILGGDGSDAVWLLTPARA